MRSPARASGTAAAWASPSAVRPSPGNAVSSAPATFAGVWPCRIRSSRTGAASPAEERSGLGVRRTTSASTTEEAPAARAVKFVVRSCRRLIDSESPSGRTTCTLSLPCTSGWSRTWSTSSPRAPAGGVVALGAQGDVGGLLRLRPGRDAASATTWPSRLTLTDSSSRGCAPRRRLDRSWVLLVGSSEPRDDGRPCRAAARTPSHAGFRCHAVVRRSPGARRWGGRAPGGRLS